MSTSIPQASERERDQRERERSEREREREIRERVMEKGANSVLLN